MQNLRAYWRIVAISAREEGANPQRLITSIVQLMARLLLIIAIYKVAYAFNPNPGLGFANTIWSISMYLAFVLSLGLREVARLIDLEVKAGNVEVGLIKPLDWRLTMICRLLGKRGLEFLILLVLIPLVLVMVVGLPDVSHVTLAVFAVFVVTVVLCIVMVAALFVTVGLSAFWLNDAQSVYRIVDKMMAAFAGAFVPIALLPSVVQTIVRWSPGGVYASPQYIFSPSIGELLLPTLISSVLWAAALFAFCQWVWKRAERRIEVNGG